MYRIVNVGLSRGSSEYKWLLFRSRLFVSFTYSSSCSSFLFLVSSFSASSFLSCFFYTLPFPFPTAFLPSFLGSLSVTLLSNLFTSFIKKWDLSNSCSFFLAVLANSLQIILYLVLSLAIYFSNHIRYYNYTVQQICTKYKETGSIIHVCIHRKSCNQWHCVRNSYGEVELERQRGREKDRRTEGEL